MKKSKLLKIIKEETDFVLKEIYMVDSPVELGAQANLQTALKSKNKQKIERAIEHIKGLGLGQGTVSSAALALAGSLAGATASEALFAIKLALQDMSTMAFMRIYKLLPAGIQNTLFTSVRDSISSTGKGGDAMRQVFIEMSKILQKP
tara:strand:- start:117 stop:560 length:444 start_codon:yes stop_codon:yes gene_type:complete